MKSKYLPWVVGIGLPLVCIVVLTLVVYIPLWSLKPVHNFVYTTRNGYNNYNASYYAYSVSEGHIMQTQVDPIPENGAPKSTSEPQPNLYLYDVQHSTTKAITFADAQKLTLDPGPTSNDGYRVDYGYRDSGIFELFGRSGNESPYYLSHGNTKKQLPGIVTDGYYYRDSFTFIGWVQ